MFLMITMVISNVFVYPVFSSLTNITQKDMKKINDYNETENNVFLDTESVLSELINKDEQIQDDASSTIRKDKSQISVSRLDWFDTVNFQFENHKKTRVIDVHSGKNFYVYRNGGIFHAEVEPVNLENTQTFFEIYGFNWSWTRRPVWVEVSENLWSAGSMNGYPHGKANIENAGTNGHTCIHFLNSKTHGTKRVCPCHQACIDYAYQNRHNIYSHL